MSVSDHEARLTGSVIPFQPRPVKTQQVKVSTIAALIAVTILHDEDISAEEKLLQLIEESGDAEIIDASDALDDLCEAGDDTQITAQADAKNDNLR